MIANEVVNRAIAYILEHAGEVTVDEVAEYCHFSKFYFAVYLRRKPGKVSMLLSNV